jgi:hypothetical protein
MHEFEARNKRNARYSLRAFATALEIDHSTLSQIFRGDRRICTSQMRNWGRKLGMSSEEISVYIAAYHVPEEAILRRQEQMRHWTAEAMAVARDRTHWKLVELTRSRDFRPDFHWLAQQLAVSVDDVNVALSRLLRLRLLRMGPGNKWHGAAKMKESEFQKRALIKVRKLAAEDGVPLGRITAIGKTIGDNLK